MVDILLFINKKLINLDAPFYTEIPEDMEGKNKKIRYFPLQFASLR